MMILVTGGASSGKSAYAEQLACSLPGSRYYLAAMKPFGEEGARRIARHRALRAGKGFVTVECYDGLETVTDTSLAEAEARAEGAPEAGLPCADPLRLRGAQAQRERGLSEPAKRASSAAAAPERRAVSPSGSAQGSPASGAPSARASASASEVDERENEACYRTALLESLGNVVANALFADDGSCATYDEAFENVLAGVEHVASIFDHVVIVGDEVGSDGLSYDATTETYLRLIGSSACAIAAQCDVVVECVAGQPFIVKGAQLL